MTSISFIIPFGLYTFFLLIIWGFFVVARLHSYKFKNFSNNIEFLTRLLFFFLLILSIIGYIYIFSIKNEINTNIVEKTGMITEETYY